jgi:hypothetical protein
LETGLAAREGGSTVGAATRLQSVAKRESLVSPRILRQSNLPPSGGSIGSTTVACSNRLVTCQPLNSRRATMSWLHHGLARAPSCFGAIEPSEAAIVTSPSGSRHSCKEGARNRRPVAASVEMLRGPATAVTRRSGWRLHSAVNLTGIQARMGSIVSSDPSSCVSALIT